VRVCVCVCLYARGEVDMDVCIRMCESDECARRNQCALYCPLVLVHTAIGMLMF